MTSTEVLSRATQHLGGTSVDELRRTVTATPSSDLDLITVTAQAPTAERAAAAADAVGTAYQDLKAESVRSNAEAAIDQLSSSRDDLRRQVDQFETALSQDNTNNALRAQRDAAVAQLVTLENRMSQIDINSALFGSGVSTFETAAVPGAPASPRPVRNALAAAILGLLAAGTFAWWRTGNSPLAENRHDPAPVLGAPLLGELPEFDHSDNDGELPAAVAPSSPMSERYQFIVSSLDFALSERNATAVAVTSAGAGDGKTISTINLAAAATADGRRVMVVDADERRRRVTRLAAEAGHLGLVDLARSDVALEACLTEWQFAGGASVKLMPAGTDAKGAAAFFRSPEFRKAMTRVKSGADLVLVDTPPVLAVSEVADIASEVDGVVVVVRQGTPLEALEDVRARLAMAQAPIVGYIFNRSTNARFGYARYGRYYQAAYGNGYEPGPVRGRRRRP